MSSISLNVENQFANAFQAEKAKAYENTVTNDYTDYNLNKEKTKIHNSAVNVSISMESMKVFLNIKSVEISQNNASAQNSLMNIVNNTELYEFFSGKETENGFSLLSIGYEGKPINELTPSEAKDLVSDEGFFGVIQTSSRVSSFVVDLAGDNIEALQEARKGIVRGFEEAEKMWGGKLPEISYETQEKTLEIIDEKINELLKTDTQKELEN